MAKELKHKLDIDKLDELEGQDPRIDIILKMKARGNIQAAEKLFDAMYRRIEKKPGMQKVKERMEFLVQKPGPPDPK